MASEYPSPQQIMAGMNPNNGLPEAPYPQQAMPMVADMHPDNSPGVGPVNFMQMPIMAPSKKSTTQKGKGKRGK